MTEPWKVYIIHFSERFHHARHYIGITNLSLEERLARHKGFAGAKITSAAIRAGVLLESIHLLGEYENGALARAAEIWHKSHKKSQRFCPLCHKQKG